MKTMAVATSTSRILTQTVIGIDGAHELEEHVPHAALMLDDHGDGKIWICDAAGGSTFDVDDIEALVAVLNHASEIRAGLRVKV